MVRPDDTAQDWTECQPGTISTLGCELRAQRRSRDLRNRSLFASGVSLVLVIGSISLLNHMTGGHAVEFVCTDVERVAVSYLDGRLDDDENQAVEQHVAHCHRCEELLAKLKERHKSSSNSDSSNQKLSEPELALAGL